MCGHATTCYNYPMEKRVSAEGIYIDHGTYSGRHVNAATQEIECLHDDCSHEMHGSKTRSCDFITRRETKFLRAHIRWSIYSHLHKYYRNVCHLSHQYFVLKPIRLNIIRISHVPTHIDAQPSHRCSNAMSEFELRRSGI